MQNIVIDKPYVPVPPYHGKLWPRLLTFWVPRMLRKKYGVTRVTCLHADRLARSIAAGDGVLITPNHCRDEDPLILGYLSRQIGSPFFIVASWHLFMGDPKTRFFLRRAGAFSIYREGVDRSAVNTCIDILESAERPLVIFPEGLISRTNDHLNDLLEGTGLIARSAAKKRAKLDPPRKVVVHPVAIRYELQGDVEKAVGPVIDEIESRLTWRKRPGVPLIERIYKVGDALVGLKEFEYLGEARHGDVGPRLQTLIDFILDPLEQQWLKEKHADSTPTRVKRLRSAILPDLASEHVDDAERDRRWRQLADLYLAQQLSHYPPDYVKSNPAPQRLLETVERFEEDLTDQVKVHGEIHATVTVGEAIEAPITREGRGNGDALMDQIASELEKMLGIAPVADEVKT
jgi:1-acyl-sn-glycerol-3-phosphate acyltransferase